jgi:hypothetical protein
VCAGGGGPVAVPHATNGHNGPCFPQVHEGHGLHAHVPGGERARLCAWAVMQGLKLAGREQCGRITSRCTRSMIARTSLGVASLWVWVCKPVEFLRALLLRMEENSGPLSLYPLRRTPQCAQLFGDLPVVSGPGGAAHTPLLSAP